MTERGILFSAPMVRALLDGSKTQTRRSVKGIIDGASYQGIDKDGLHLFTKGPAYGKLGCPYGQPGDRLWVRETWRHTAGNLEEARAITEDIASGTAVDWRADYIARCMRDLGFSREEAEMADDFETWRPSIHMPRWASRILLEIVSVRVERLQDINEADALAEGPQPHPAGPVCAFSSLWRSINGVESWVQNPWVWVVEFRRIES